MTDDNLKEFTGVEEITVPKKNKKSVSRKRRPGKIHYTFSKERMIYSGIILLLIIVIIKQQASLDSAIGQIKSLEIEKNVAEKNASEEIKDINSRNFGLHGTLKSKDRMISKLEGELQMLKTSIAGSRTTVPSITQKAVHSTRGPASASARSGGVFSSFMNELNILNKEIHGTRKNSHIQGNGQGSGTSSIIDNKDTEDLQE